jgi:ADP-heptose:LPS heptosyltransferase
VKVRERIAKLAKEANIHYTPGKEHLILINPNASDLLPQRRWAQQRFSELIQAIHQQYPNDLILITGSPAEVAYVEKVRAVANVKNALNFAGQVSFAELPPLYTLSDVMVTNDSGPGHFSAVTPLRTVVLFGPETPALYGSIGNSIAITANLACSPCVSAANHRKTPCHDNVCMQAITVQQVLDKVTKQLQDADKAKAS